MSPCTLKLTVGNCGQGRPATDEENASLSACSIILHVHADVEIAHSRLSLDSLTKGSCSLVYRLCQAGHLFHVD